MAGETGETSGQKASAQAQRVARADRAADADGNEAMRALCPVIQFLALRVVRGSKGWGRAIADDFVLSSPSLVFEELRKGNFDPARGPFKAWCHEVLRTRFVSELRRQKRHRLPSLDDVTGEEMNRDEVADAGPAPSDAVVSRDESAAHLSTTVLHGVEQWPARQRVVALTLGLLWNRVPPTLWARWCAECSIPDRFPPEDFLEHTPQNCQALVAEALGVTMNHLYVLKHRAADRLVDLVPDVAVVRHIVRRRSGREHRGGELEEAG